MNAGIVISSMEFLKYRGKHPRRLADKGQHGLSALHRLYETADGIAKVGGAKEGKAIIILNPAEPPLLMRDTIHCLTEDEPDQGAITDSIKEMIEEVKKYVPGYRLVNGPVFDGKRVSIFLEVEGLGDYLPKYAGNLDIMTAAAVEVGDQFAKSILGLPTQTTATAGSV